MTPYILAVLGLWLAQIFFAASFKTVFAPDTGAAVQDHLRGKDRTVSLSTHGGRAVRAQENLLESIVVFLPLALLHELSAEGPTSLATQGAAVFVVARLIYVPAYQVAIPGVRTLTWMVGLVGLGMMVVDLI